MAISKNFIVKNGLEVAENLIYADNQSVGIGTTVTDYLLTVDGSLSLSGRIYVPTDEVGVKTTTGIVSTSSLESISEIDVSELLVGDYIQGNYIQPNTRIVGIATSSLAIFPNHVDTSGLTTVSLTFLRYKFSGEPGDVLISRGNSLPPTWATPEATNAATATTAINVIGGIGSIKLLDVSGISTFNSGIFSGTTTDDLVLIKQTGTGNALRVEDSENPDSTPFIIDSTGQVGIKTNQPNYDLDIRGTILLGNSLYVEGGELNTRIGILSGTDRTIISGIDTTGLEVSDIVKSDALEIVPGTVIESVGINSVGITPQHNRFGTPITVSLNIERNYYSGLDGEVLLSRGPGLPPNWSAASNATIQNISTTTTYYPTFVEDSGRQAIGIAKSELVFIPDPGNLGIGSTTPSERLDVDGNIKVSNTVSALSYLGNGETLSGIVTQINAGIGVRISATQLPGKGVVNIDSYFPIGKTIFVTQNGNDRNSGLTENDAKRTIKAAAAISFPGDTIKVYPGVYVENNPITLPKRVAVEGTELRNCVVTPKFPDRDLFYVNNSCHITDLSFIGPQMYNGASIVALQPLLGVATDRFFDASRMIRYNLDYIANESVGFLTSGFSGFAGNHREQDAARLIDLNIDFIAAEAIGFLTSTDYKTPAFTIVNSSGIATDPVNCSDDIKDILRSISYDLKAGSNKKVIGAGLSYYDNGGTLLHITGTDPNGYSVKDATIAAIEHAVGIVTFVINNTPYTGTTYSNITQNTTSYSPILVSGGCTDTAQKIETLAGIVTSILDNYSNLSGITTVYGVNLESKDCADDIKDIWKCVIHDITRGGNSRCVAAGKSYYDENWNLIPQILKNPGEVEQTISTLEYSFDIARAVINNVSWGGYPAGVSTSVSSAEYDYKTGITTITAPNHGLSTNDPVKIQNLTFECAENSPGESVGIATASYDNVSGIATISTTSPLNISSGLRIKLDNLLWECESGGVPSTQYFPSGNYRYDFTVLDVIDSNTFRVNVGTSTLPHTYIGEGTAARVYTPKFGISTAQYDESTGITTVVLSGLGTNTDPVMFVEPDQKIKLDKLVWECDSGGGLSTAYFPSGANGYDFTIISTVDDRYFDASNLIEANRIEIIDKSLAAIAIAHSDFYFPNDVQTTRFSRFRDSYRLIQQNKTEIINSAWTATALQYPSISATETKCKRDIGYFIDAVSTDLFTGGNSYSIAFVNQYFNNGAPISNGLVGEEVESVYAFNQVRNLMKSAITNQLTIKDLTLTADPETGSNVDINSCANVRNTIDTLTSIITTVITNGTLDTLNSIALNPGIFTFGENKCRRDIGFVVDALIKDVRYGTNKHIREAARAYFNANGSPISNGLIGEEAESVTAFNAIRDYAKLAINNLLNAKDLSITADPLTGSNIDPNSCADVQSNIDNLISILTTTITNGNLDSFPTLYVSNKIKVNVGVSTIAHTYVEGGTAIANYTTEIFPDGTFGYIFPVKKVIDSNTFEFVGGKTVIDHTYVGGGTVQKYGNFQNTFSQVKDLSMQPDPKTGFNNAINGCTDVTSAIRSCVGVVTSIVGLGSEANIRTSYPGNRGVGIENTTRVLGANYNHETGIVQLNAPGIEINEGDIIELRDLLFECASGVTTSSQIFPSGKYGYNFYVDTVNDDGTFDVSVGISTIPHTYVSGGHIINRQFKITEAYYDNATGITTIVAPGTSLRRGDVVSLRGLEFACNSGAGTTTIYPTGNNGYDFQVLDVVGFGNTFVVNTGVSTIHHTYVSDGVVIPPYSPGVGPITQGPYIRNCTNFVPGSIGMKVDGFDAEPGDQDDIGITGTMSVDSYTQYNQGGIGVSITNGAYSQLVSIFTICDDIAIFTGSGGQCDITNSNSSFGTYGLMSDGVGDFTSKSIYRHTGVAHTVAEAEQPIIEVSGIGSLRPYDGQTLHFGELYYEVQSITVDDGGFGYTQAPVVTIDFPTGPNGIRAEASANINSFGQVTSIDIISSGNQYRLSDNPKITIAPPTGSGTTATASLNFYPIYYTIESATLPNSGISTITLNTNLNNTVSAGTTVYFNRLSLQITSSHSFEWVGSGNNINIAKPALGGVVIQENEVVKLNGGEVVYTSTDQAGNFKIGDDFTINQLTGTVTGRAFNQSILNTVTPLIIALGN